MSSDFFIAIGLKPIAISVNAGCKPSTANCLRQLQLFFFYNFLYSDVIALFYLQKINTIKP
jgi:hypothetical protein